MHGNKLHLIKAPWFSKFSDGKLPFLSVEGVGVLPPFHKAAVIAIR